MKSRSHPRTVTLLITAAIFNAAGCSTHGPAPSSRTVSPATHPVSMPAPPPAPDGVPLTAGMKAGDVETLLGRPVEIRPMEIDGIKADVWVYRRPGKPVTREITTGMRDVHYVDPISGRELIRQEPIIGYETETPNLELRLLMFDGSLVNWSQVVTGSDKSVS